MQGQINIGSVTGDLIYDLCKISDIINIVEIGTWNGQGSTYCIYKSIIDSTKTDYKVISVEVDLAYYNKAKALYNAFNISNFFLLYGRVVEISDVQTNLNIIDDKFFKEYPRVQQKVWLDQDIINMTKADNVVNLLPSTIDLLILDGGEFSTYADFSTLKNRTKIFILDDSEKIKGFKIKQEIESTPREFPIILNAPTVRNGVLLFTNSKLLPQKVTDRIKNILIKKKYDSVNNK